jgi:uncharacterized BrkB/YihY/UPF0761 family membrane protein
VRTIYCINLNSDNEIDDAKRDELIFELIKRRFDQEIQRTQNLDQKAGTMVGFVSVLVGLLLGSGSLLGDDNTLSSIFKSNEVIKFTYFGGIAMLLVSVGFSMIALKVRKWQTVPNVQILISEFVHLAAKFSKQLQLKWLKQFKLQRTRTTTRENS